MANDEPAQSNIARQLRHSRPTEKPMIAAWCPDTDRPLAVDEELRAMINRETVLAVVAMIGVEGFRRLGIEPLPCPVQTPARKLNV